MKFKILIALVSCLTLAALADGPVIQTTPFMRNVLGAQSSSDAQTRLGFSGTTTLTVISNTAIDAVGLVPTLTVISNTALEAVGPLPIVPMSTGAGNYAWDMIPARNAYAGQLGMSWALNGNYTNACAALWASAQVGMGSNTWGVPISFLGSINYVGDPYWSPELSNSVSLFDQDQAGYYWGFGPNASSLGTVWPSLVQGSGASKQPYFNVVNANPWAAGAAIDIRSGFTNASTWPYMQSVGSDINGNAIYVPQFGYWIGQISDAYKVNDPFKNGESQDGAGQGGYVFIGSTPQNSYFITYNGSRSGDSVSYGQVPMEVIDTATHGIAEPIFRVPLQVPNVWMPYTNGVVNP
ncbi:MAG: hypothetical protein ACREFR_20065, partial [Limisphaerales bacterium]